MAGATPLRSGRSAIKRLAEQTGQLPPPPNKRSKTTEGSSSAPNLQGRGKEVAAYDVPPSRRELPPPPAAVLPVRQVAGQDSPARGSPRRSGESRLLAPSITAREKMKSIILDSDFSPYKQATTNDLFGQVLQGLYEVACKSSLLSSRYHTHKGELLDARKDLKASQLVEAKAKEDVATALAAFEKSEQEKNQLRSSLLVSEELVNSLRGDLARERASRLEEREKAQAELQAKVDEAAGLATDEVLARTEKEIAAAYMEGFADFRAAASLKFPDLDFASISPDDVPALPEAEQNEDTRGGALPVTEAAQPSEAAQPQPPEA